MILLTVAGATNQLKTSMEVATLVTVDAAEEGYLERVANADLATGITVQSASSSTTIKSQQIEIETAVLSY